VGAFAAASILSYEFCHYQRRQERVKMQRAVQNVTTTRAQKLEEVKQQRKHAAEETTAKKSWYRFW